MNRMLVMAMVATNLVVLGTAVRVFSAYRSVVPYQAVPLTVTTSAFTYQGRLQHNGQLFTGACDLTFDLFDASSGGSPIGSQTLKALPVTGGLFTAALDFGADAFNGGPRWLETTVQCNGADGIWTLAPRQPITVAPVALSARNLTTDASPQLEGTTVDPLGALLSAVNDGAGPGLRGRSENGGPGVTGSSPSSGPGVSGASSTGPGVSGTSSHGSGVYGYGYASDAVGVTGEGNNGAPALKAVGNVVQSASGSGWAKALVEVEEFGRVSHCYNGVAGQEDSSGTNSGCGFTVTHVIGDSDYRGKYIIDFGFDVSQRFLMITPKGLGAVTANYYRVSEVSSQVEVILADFISQTTLDSDFYLAVY